MLFQQVCHFVKLDYVVNDGDCADADVNDLIVDCIVLVNFDLVDHLVQIVLRLPETNSLVEVFVIDSKITTTKILGFFLKTRENRRLVVVFTVYYRSFIFKFLNFTNPNLSTVQ